MGLADLFPARDQVALGRAPDGRSLAPVAGDWTRDGNAREADGDEHNRNRISLPHTARSLLAAEAKLRPLRHYQVELGNEDRKYMPGSSVNVLD